mgnify:CR=1 FL=1
MSDYGNRMMPMEAEEVNDEVEQVVEQETQEVLQEPIFDKGEKEKKPKKKRVMTDEAKAKLVDRLKLGREKSLLVRKAKAEEKRKNKKPVGRPKKNIVEEKIPITKVILEDKTEVSFPTPEPEKTVNNNVVMEIKEQELPKNKPIQQHTNTIDYDKIVNSLYDKFKSETIKPPASKPVNIPKPTLPTPRQRQDDMEARIRADERMRMKQEQNAVFSQKSKEREDRLKQATKNYYSKLPQTNFFQPTDWDNLFNQRK